MLPFKTGPAMFALKTKTPIRPFYIQKAKKAKKIYYSRRGVRAFRFLRGGLNKENLEAATEFIRVKVTELKEKLNREPNALK